MLISRAEKSSRVAPGAARDDRPALAPLRILHVNKFFWVKGGSERYLFDVMAGLSSRGHAVVPFSMRHEKNEPTPHADHFVSSVDFHASGSIGELVGRARRFVASGEARRRIADLIERERPDVAHLHNVAHQITPSILEPLRSAGIPVVQTLHDYKLICSSYLLYANGRTCERCRGGNHLNAIGQRCHHGSLSKSALGAVEMGWHAARRSYRNVARFLCPSRFMQKKCEEFGVDPRRLVHFPYFIDASRYRPEYEPGGYALFVGRLSREKGVGTLIEAARQLRSHPLVVLGEGPLRDELAARATATGASIRFAGHQGGEELHDLIRGASFVVVPSEWYENLPYAVLEAFALGKPVLGARIGGIPELVAEGHTGMLFHSGDAGDLARTWDVMASNTGRLTDMGRNARRLIESEFDPDAHLTRLTGIYRSLAA